jgi:hypothetical protein
MPDFWNNWVRENYQKVVTIAAFIFGFLWSVDTVNVKYISVRPTRDQELRNVIGNMPKIEQQLREILSRYGATRVVVFRVYSDYLDRDNAIIVPGSMTKTSIYSVTADSAVAALGVPMALSEVTHLPGSLLSPILNSVMNCPTVSLNIITDKLPQTALKELFEKRNTVESIWVAIPNSQTDFAGILQIEWPHGLDANKKQKIAQELPNYSKLVGRYL